MDDVLGLNRMDAATLAGILLTEPVSKSEPSSKGRDS